MMILKIITTYSSFNGVPLPTVHYVELFRITNQTLLPKLDELCRQVIGPGSSINKEFTILVLVTFAKSSKKQCVALHYRNGNGIQRFYDVLILDVFVARNK